MKYHIERNTVQETLVIPIYARKMCSELYPNLFRDETAVRLIDEIDYDFSALAKKSQSMMQQFGYLQHRLSRRHRRARRAPARGRAREKYPLQLK